MAARIKQHQPGCVDLEKLEASIGQLLHELDRIEVVSQGARQFDEELSDALSRETIKPPVVEIVDHEICA